MKRGGVSPRRGEGGVLPSPPHCASLSVGLLKERPSGTSDRSSGTEDWQPSRRREQGYLSHIICLIQSMITSCVSDINTIHQRYFNDSITIFNRRSIV